MKNGFSDIEKDLEEKDLNVMLKDIRMAYKMLYVMLGVNIVLAITFMVFYPHPLALIISLILSLIVIGLIFFVQKKSSTIQKGKKRVITGVITQMEIDYPGSTVEYKVNDKDNTVTIKIKTPAGTEERTEPLELGAGTKDDFFYYLFFQQGRLTVAREIYFTFKPGDVAEIEITNTGYILNYRIKN